MIEDRINLLEGCRAISSLANTTSKEDDFLLPIIGIVSDTDDIPLGDIRKNFSKEYLEESDKKFKKYITKEKPLIIKICKKIINKYSQNINEFEKLIRNIIIKNDPIKIYFNDIGENYSYETETNLILKELIRCKSEEQVADMIRFIFIDMYGKTTKEDKEIFEKIGKQIWSLIKNN